MSKLIESLTKLSQATPPPMGFRTVKQSKASLAMLILGRMAIKGTTPPAKLDSGADAVLVYTDKATIKPEDIKKSIKPLGNIPWGAYLEDSGDTAQALIDAGCDFMVFSPTSRIPDLPQDEKTGKIILVESSMDDGLLRAINDLPADAVLITDTLDNKDTLSLH